VAFTVTARTPPRPGGPPQDARTCSLKGLSISAEANELQSPEEQWSVSEETSTGDRAVAGSDQEGYPLAKPQRRATSLSGYGDYGWASILWSLVPPSVRMVLPVQRFDGVANML